MKLLLQEFKLLIIKKLNFFNIEKTKGFKFIHAEGQSDNKNNIKKIYISFGPSYAPLEQTQVENAVLN